MAGARRVVNVLILRIVAVALLLSLVTSAFLALVYYRDEQRRVAGLIREIEDTELRLLAASLRAGDTDFIETILNGIERRAVIGAAWVETELGRVIGEIAETDLSANVYPVPGETPGREIGRLHIQPDYSVLRRNVRRRSLTALTIQLATVVVLSAVFYLIVHLSVIRHLLTIAGYMRRLHLDGTLFPLHLDRPDWLTSSAPDELDELTGAINEVLSHLKSALSRRQHAEAQLKQAYARSQELVRRQTEELSLANRLLSAQVSELQETRDELEAARHQEATISRAKSEFLATVSHEVRTPIAGIIGVVRLLVERKDTAAVRDHLEMILGSAIDLHQIVDDIVEYSRYQHEEPVIHASPFSLCRAAEDSGRLYQYQAGEHGTTIVTECVDDLPARVVGDGERVRQILRNLISNAVKFTRNGEVRVRVAPIRRDGDRVEVSISVIDSGVGIPSDKMERLFSPYYQVEREAGTGVGGGSGLGLAISKQLAEYMGGGITAVSDPGRGSTFTVTIPFTVADDSCAEAPVSKGDSEVVGRLRDESASHTILLAEDNGINRYYVRELLKTIGYRVVEAVDGADALRKIGEQAPELVLMDVEMPEMNGIEATRRLRASGGDRRIPVVALSAYEEGELLERTAGADFDAVLPKPVDEQRLFDLVEELLSGGS